MFLSAEPAALASVTGPVGWHFVLARSLPFPCLCCPQVHPHPPLGPWSGKGLNREPPWGPKRGSTRRRLASLGFVQVIAQATASCQLSPHLPREEERRRDPATKEEMLSLQFPQMLRTFCSLCLQWRCFFPLERLPLPPSPFFNSQVEGPTPREGEARAVVTGADRSPLSPVPVLCLASSRPNTPPCSSIFPWPPPPPTHWR